MNNNKQTKQLVRQLISEMMRLDPSGVALAAIDRLGDMAESESDWDSQEAAELRNRMLSAKLPKSAVDDAVDAACETHTYIEQLRFMDIEDEEAIANVIDEFNELLDGLEEMLL